MEAAARLRGSDRNCEYIGLSCGPDARFRLSNSLSADAQADATSGGSEPAVKPEPHSDVERSAAHLNN